MENNVNRQQRRFMKYNMVAFTLIFTAFGFIIYNQIVSSLYFPVDEMLRKSMDGIRRTPGFAEEQINFRFEQSETQLANFGDPEPNKSLPDNERQSQRENDVFLPLRTQSIVRDDSGTILNEMSLGRVYWQDLLAEISLISFSTERLDHITSFSLRDGGHYRSLTFKKIESGKTYYIQLLVNLDGEHAVINSFMRIVIICVAAFAFLSIMASYILSKKTIDPLVMSWNRQIEFVENASHELRTPLTIIQNKVESLLTKPDSTVMDHADDVAVVLSETRRLTKLTSDLMTLARADSNETQLNRTIFDLDELISTLCEPYAELATMENKTLTLHLSGGHINADSERIHQLMVILLDNAIKYTRDGDAIQVHTSMRDSRMFIEVIDTGIGINEESISRIFDRFYREDKARSREKGGSGLGLSIAKWIVDSHGGSLYATHNSPCGTVVQVNLKIDA